MSTQTSNNVLLEQVELLRQRTPVIVYGTLAITAILVYVLRSWFPLSSLLYWSAAVVVLSLIRLLVHKHYLDNPATIKNAATRATMLTFHSGISGCLWGVLGFFFVDAAQPIASVMIVMVLTGMVASAIASLSVILPAFFAFMIPAFLPAVYRFATLGDDVYFTISILILVFMLASLYFAFDNFKSVRKSILLRFDNLGLINDLSLEKQRADEARVKAESANLAKSKFLAAASHDLRQPMHALRLFTSELTEQTQDSEYQSIVTNIGLSVKALEGLFNALLDISKLDAGTLTVERQHVRLQLLFDRLEHDYTGRARERSLELVVEPTNATVYSDPTLLERVLRNLLGNAVSYTARGNISLRAINTDEGLTIQVQDTGPGIAPENQEKIFDEFTQLHNPERDHNKGLGLGLSIVRRIALLLEHPLILDSVPGLGTKFSLLVPLGDAAAVVPVISATDSEQDCSQLFVLVIEDEYSVREGLTSLLKHWQCVVLAVESLDSALLKLADYEYGPEVILSDFRLPEHTTGIEAIGSVRSIYGQDIPALIMTGDTDPERLREAHASAIPLLHKPFEPLQLKAFLSSVKQQKKNDKHQVLEGDTEEQPLN